MPNKQKCVKCGKTIFVKKIKDDKENNKDWFFCNYCNFTFWKSKKEFNQK